MKAIRKAVIPVAGLGTRFLPATKAIPKEMLTIVDRPTIQYIVEEAVASGIEQVILITSAGKSAIENHFDYDFQLDTVLKGRNKVQLREELNNISNMNTYSYFYLFMLRFFRIVIPELFLDLNTAVQTIGGTFKSCKESIANYFYNSTFEIFNGVFHYLIMILQ